MVKSIPCIHLKRYTHFIGFKMALIRHMAHFKYIYIIYLSKLKSFVKSVPSDFKGSHILSRQTLKSGKSVKLSRAEVLQKIGELFALR